MSPHFPSDTIHTIHQNYYSCNRCAIITFVCCRLSKKQQVIVLKQITYTYLQQKKHKSTCSNVHYINNVKRIYSTIRVCQICKICTNDHYCYCRRIENEKFYRSLMYFVVKKVKVQTPISLWRSKSGWSIITSANVSISRRKEKCSPIPDITVTAL